MIPYDWNTLDAIVKGSGTVDPGFTVFNGWAVTYTILDEGNTEKTYGIYVEKPEGSETYSYSAKLDSTKPNDHVVLCRIMPGDGVKFGDNPGYDPGKKVLTLPTGAKNVTFTAVWDEPQIVKGNSNDTLLSVYSKLNTTNYNPITGDGSIFTNIIYADRDYGVKNKDYNTINGKSKSATILGSGTEITFTVNSKYSPPSNFPVNIPGETYFENITLDNGSDQDYEMRSGNSRLILGENVKTTTKTTTWYSNINNGNTMKGFRVYDASNCIILGGNYAIVAGTRDKDTDSYISVGSQYSGSASAEKLNIFMLYGAVSINTHNLAQSETHILVNSGNVLELIGGARISSTKSSTIEVAGGYVSYLTGGPRSGNNTVGTGSDTTAVKINVSGGTVDYLFSGAKDGNSSDDTNHAPVNGNVEIKVSDGKIYALFGGGYDFWSKTVGYGVIGNINILITGGQIGESAEESSTNYWINIIGNSISGKPSNYYEISPGVYGGGYRGSVKGDVTIKIGTASEATPSAAKPMIYGNVYGGGSGGADLSLRVNNDVSEDKPVTGAHNDTTGKSHIVGNTNVVIGNAAITGNVYGGGMGVAKSSYVKIEEDIEFGTNNKKDVVGNKLGIFTDLDTENREVAKVTGTTTVKIQNNADISGNVYGGGKGVSRSVFIGPETQNSPNAVSELYGYSENEKREIKYEWQYCSSTALNFEKAEGSSDSDSYSITNTSGSLRYDSGYLRLKVTLNNESVYSNALSITNSALSFGAGFDKDKWNEWNTGLDSIAKVEGSTNVYVFNGKIEGNVYGGGSLAVVNGSTSVSMSGGVVGEGNGGKVFGGGEGESVLPWAGQVTGTASLTISGGNVKGSVYGGGDMGIVGAEYTYDETDGWKITKSNSGSSNLSTTVTISQTSDQIPTYIAGSVYGGGRGNDADEKLGAVYGDTSVTVSGGKIGYYYSDSPEKSTWYNHEDAGGVYGGGKLGIVSGDTNVKISGGDILRNVFGGGKGASKSVFIELNSVTGMIESSLYNLLDESYLGDLDGTYKNLLTSKLSTVTSYKWEGSSDGIKFSTISGADKRSLTDSQYSTYSYIRLTVTVDNKTLGSEEIESNVYSINSDGNLAQKDWEHNLVSSSLLASVKNTTVTVSGGTIGGQEISGADGTITTKGNVYGGGAYAVVGSLEHLDQSSDADSGSGNHIHMFTGGTTSVTINGGEITGSVYGGGMGELDDITTGSVGKTTVNISGGTITGSVYGGGENGFAGNTNIIADSFFKVSIPGIASETDPNPTIPTNTYRFTIILDPRTDDADPNSSFKKGTSEVTITDGEIGGSVFGGGYGANATVANSTVVSLNGSFSIKGSVYGGGNLGQVGHLTGTFMADTESSDLKLTGGITDVKIIGSVTVNGSVYGGGKGTDSLAMLDSRVMGSVGSSAAVTINNGTTVKGNVYGGGELGIVGNVDYSAYSNDSDKNFLGFTGGITSVTINGGTIGSGKSGSSLNDINNSTGNVYGGGKGFFAPNVEYIILGAVGESSTVTINNGTIHGNAFGGGELGIVGTYKAKQLADEQQEPDPNTLAAPSSKYDTLTFETHDSNYSQSKLIIKGGKITGSVYGGGKGTTANIISGAVGRSILIIGNGTIEGSVYGGGGLAFVGSMTIDVDEKNGANISDHKMESSKNDSYSTLVILGGTINGSVYGGGFGPRAVINGSTHVFLGIPAAGTTSYPKAADVSGLEQSNITIEGSVYGGGEMGSVGFIAFNTGGNGVPSFVTDNYDGPVDENNERVNLGSNVKITSNSESITITENVFGGGKGGDLYTVITTDKETKGETRTYYIEKPEDFDISDKNNVIRYGYAIVHGDSKVDINGGKIEGSVYGGGEGIQYSYSNVSTIVELDKIIYAAVTNSSSVSINGANVAKNVYGGGEFGIIGYYKDVLDKTKPPYYESRTNVREFYGGNTKVVLLGATVKDVYGSGMGTTANILSGAVGNTAVIIANNSKITGSVYGGGSYALVSGTGLKTHLYADEKDENGTLKINPHMIEAKNNAEAIVVILGAEISGSVYGGSYGPRAVVAGSTYVFIGKLGGESDAVNNIYHGAIDGITVLNGNNQSIEINGSVYGGGDMGSVGFVSYLEGTENRNHFGDGYKPVKDVSANVFITSLEPSAKAALKIDVGGDVFGGGKGGDLYVWSNPSKGDPTTGMPPGWTEETSGRTIYGYAIVHGDSLVKITGTYTEGRATEISIAGDVYGGGMGIERGGTGSISDLGVIQYAAVTKSSRVEITHASIAGNIHGGGNLGIVGYYIDDGDVSNVGSEGVTRTFTGNLATTIISDSLIRGNIYGSGRGTTSNLLSGAVGNTTVIISNSSIRNVSDLSSQSEDEVKGGSVFGGGAYSLVGSFILTITDSQSPNDSDVAPASLNPTVTTSENKAEVVVIILGGTIDENVFGGGYGPRAVIAGSAYVFLGSYADNSGININDGIKSILFESGNTYKTQFKPSEITIKGSVYGGGNMGSIGVLPHVFSFEGVDDYSKVNQNIDANNKISANVFIRIDNDSAEISINKDVYGGGKGGDLYAYTDVAGNRHVSSKEPNEGAYETLQTLKGYAVIYGTTNVEIIGSSNSEKKVSVEGSVYGGGDGLNVGLDAIQYAEVYDSSSVFIQNASVGSDVYGGGNFAVIGHYHSSGGPIYKSDDGKYIYARYFCGDDLQGDGSDKYKGEGSATVYIAASSVGGSVFGGGSGSEENILSGAVGRQTHVIIDDYTTVDGNVYGGGKQGIVGSVTVWIVSDTTSEGMTSNNYPTITVAFSHKSDKYDPNEKISFDNYSDTLSQVYILGGTIKGSVYGAGEGQTLVPFIINTSDKSYSWLSDLNNYDSITANKFSVFGRTEVNVSGGEIYKHVYGGSENGSIGSLTIMKQFDEFLNEYNKKNDTNISSISGIPADVRDNYDAKNTYNSAFVNIVGGMIYGNVFGGGYFGEIYGNTHVHIGWHSVMEYDGEKGDCHYYNNYRDGIFADKLLPFDVTLKDSTLYKLNQKLGSDAQITETDLISSLFIDGSVYAGGDRGYKGDGEDSNATEINYDYVSVYGTSHIFLDGTRYNTGKNTPSLEYDYAMYIRGSLFASGNSCGTFYVDKNDSRFIIIKNYKAVDNYVIYSIQRATEVTLINSSLRLPGRSDGSNSNKTALYSLNHVNELYLQSSPQGSSKLILETAVQDLRKIFSQEYNGSSYADTKSGNPCNTIQLENGITLVIAKPSDLSYNYGRVNGYFYLDLERPSYYGGYVYGYFKNLTGGFVRGSTLDNYREVISSVDMGLESTTDEEFSADGYRMWGAGRNHVESSASIIAKNSDDNSDSQSEFQVSTGTAYLPITTAGAKYKLIGFTVYPDQANSLSGSRSLNLISLADSDHNDISNSESALQWNQSYDSNTYFGLSVETGSGFEESTFMWLTPETMQNPKDTSGVSSNSTLPEFKFTLYHKGISKTGAAGTVEFIVQEQIPVTAGSEEYRYGNEIKIIVDIGTEKQIDATGEFEGNVTLYTTKTGFYEYTFDIPSSASSSMYELYIDSITIPTGFSLTGEEASTDAFKITMSTSTGRDNTSGWVGRALKDEVLLTSVTDQPLGTTDGRSYSSLYFTLSCAEGKLVDEYAKGRFVINIKAYVLDANGNRVQNKDGSDEVKDWTINVSVNSRLPQYYVSFNTAGGSSVPTQFIDENKTASEPVTDPVYSDNGNSAEFLGWYNGSTDDAGNITYANQFDFSAQITADTTVYAKWGYTITYDSLGGTVIDSAGVPLGEDTSEPATNPTRQGYEFTGWYDSKECTDESKFIFGSKLYKNITLYAGWKGNEHTLTYVIDPDDIPVPSGITLSDSSITDNKITSATGEVVTLSGLSETSFSIGDITYYFAGWNYKDKDNYPAESTFTMTDENVTLTAVWTQVQSYNVNIVADPSIVTSFEYTWTDNGTDGSYNYSSKTQFLVEAGHKVSLTISPDEISNIPGVSSYELQIDGADVTLPIEIKKDTTITVKFTCKTYNITLNANGGTFSDNSESKTITVTYGGKYGDDLSKTNGPTKPGYNFAKWYGNQDLTGDPVNPDTPVSVTSDNTLYADWTAKNYIVQFNPNYPNATEANIPQNFVYEISQELSRNTFTREGFTFQGWASSPSDTSAKFMDEQTITISNSGADGTLNITDLTGDDNPFNLYAVWQQNELKVYLSEISKQYDGSGQLPLISVGGDNYNESNRIRDPLNSSASSGGSNGYIVKWRDSNDRELERMPVNAGKYTVTVKDSSTNVTGSAFFEITPYTDKLHIEISNRTYNGTSPVPEIRVYMGGDSTTGKKVTDDITRLFDITYTLKDDPNANPNPPANAGTYTVQLTAKSTSANSNFYNADKKEAATGDGDYIIDKLAITITPDSGQWKYYGDTHIYTGNGDNTKPNTNGIGYTVKSNGQEITPGSGAYKNYAELEINLVIKDSNDADIDSEDKYSVAASDYKIVLVDGYSNANPNYNITFTKDVAFEIKPLPITITPVVNQWKYYGDAIGSSNYTIHNGAKTPYDYLDYKITLNGTELDRGALGSEAYSKYEPLTGELAVLNSSGEVIGQFEGAAADYVFGLGTLSSNNSNYKISLYGDSDGNIPITFKIEKLPIFIVPKKGQWKYYGFDGSSGSGLYIGEPGNTSNSEPISKLQYMVYDYRNPGSPTPIDEDDFNDDSELGYKKLIGDLKSDMLDETAAVSEGYAINIGTIADEENNSNYDIYYPGTQEKTLLRSMALGDDDSLAAQTGEVVVTPITITIRGSVDYNGTNEFKLTSSNYETKLTNSDLTGLVNGLASGDTIGTATLTTSSPLADEYSLSSSGNSLNVVISNSNGGNNTSSYDIIYAGSIKIDKVPLTIKIKASKEYDGSTEFTFTNKDMDNTNFEFIGLKNDGSTSDTVTKVVLTTSSANVNSYSLTAENVKVTVIHGSDEADIRTNCYDLKISNETNTFTINKKQLTINIENEFKFYNGVAWSYDNNALNNLLNGKLVDGDRITDTSRISTTLADAGTYAYTGTEPNPFTITLDTTNGITNYDVSYNLSVEIKKKEIMPEITGNHKKVYDGTTDIEISASIPDSEKIGRDDVSINSSSKYDTPYVDTDKIITLTITLTGTDAKNYTLVSSYSYDKETGTFTYTYGDGEITAKSLVISFSSTIQKEYNGSVWEYDLASNSNGNKIISGLVSGDKLESGTIKTSDLKAGTYSGSSKEYKLNYSDLLIKDADDSNVTNNYSISITGSVEITKKGLNITINASSNYSGSSSFEFTSFDSTSGFTISNTDPISRDQVTKITITPSGNAAGKYNLTNYMVKAEIWNSSDDRSGCYNLIINESSTLNIFGKITYHLNGGSYDGTNDTVTTYVDTTTNTDPIETSKSNFELDGWYKESDLSGSKVETINSTVFGNKSEINLYAKWLSEATINILLDGNNADSNLWKGFNGQVFLYQSNDTKYDITGSDGTYSKNVTPGEYDIYISYPVDSTKKAGTIDLTNGNKSENVIFYTVSFDGNDHTFTTPIPEQHILYGFTATDPDTPATSGDFSFTGWFKDKDCTDTFNFNTPITAKTVIYAGWKENTYTVDVKLKKDGTAWAGQEVKLVNNNDKSDEHTLNYGSGVYSSEVTAGTYSIFCNGENTDKSVTVDARAPSASEEINYYTVSFDLGVHGTGSAPYDQIVLENGYVTSVKNPTPDGDYAFTGWFDGETNWIFNNASNPSKVTKTTTLTAKWDLNTYKVEVTIERDNNPWKNLIVSLVAVDDTPYGLNETEDGVYSSPGIPSGTYTIKFTYDSSDYTSDLSVASGSGTNPVTLTYWTVTFDYNYNNKLKTAIILHNDILSTPTDVTREHYDLKGWFTNKECSADHEWDFDTLVTYTQTLYAKWEAEQYTITYYVDGVLYESSQLIGFGEPVTPLAAPTREGYSFSGWDWNEGDDGLGTAPQTMPAKNLSVYGCFTINSYKVTFHYNNGSEDTTTSVIFNTSITEPDVSKPGYTLDGWYSDPNFNTKWDFASYNMPAHDIDLYAKWTATLYTVKFYNETELVNSTTYTVESDLIQMPSNPSKTGYTFNGWFEKDATNEFSYIKGTTVGNIDLYAKFTINQYTITFNSNGGSEVGSITQDYATAISKPADPTKTGYTFAGWYTDDGTFNNRYSFTTMPDENIKLYAKWNANTGTPYKVEHYQQNVSGDDYTLYETVYLTGTAGDDADLGIKSYTGFTNNTSKNPSDLEIKADRSSVFEVYYDRNIHDVMFNSKDGSSVSDITGVIYGATFSEPTPAPTKSGYMFKGWFTSDDSGVTLGTEWNFSLDTMPDNDLTLYAKWEPKDTPTPTVYKVEYNANGGEGEVPKAELHFAGEFVTVKSADLKRDGYTFKGWCDSYTQISYKADETFRMPSRDVCLTAVWEENKPPIQGKEVTVTFIVDNELYGISTTHIDTALEEAMQPDPVKEGYDFAGWHTKDGQVFTADTIVKDDMTVYAEWQLNEDYVIVTFVIDDEVYLTKVCRKDSIQEPHVPIKLGKELNGWYYDKELQNKFDFNSVIEEDRLTLYAEWKDSSDFMIWLVFALFAFFIAAVIASTKRVSFYKDENDEEKYASAVIIGKGPLGDKFPQSPDSSNFLGWYSVEGELITEDTEIKYSMKLYARWKD